MAIRRIGTVVLLAVAGLIQAQAADLTNSYRGWPESWVKAYERFENFIAAKNRDFPAADFVMSPDGSVRESVRWFKSTREHLSYEFYQNGHGMLSGSAKDDSFLEREMSAYPPGEKFTVVMKSCGLLGYQYLYPIRWFETVDDGRNSRVARAIATPQPAEDYWPNERIFRFLDFNVMPQNNPNDICAENTKVKPTLTLSVDNHGNIRREPLSPELEKLLVWRIYRNGRLIEKGSAANQSQRQEKTPGGYSIFVGIEGPKGFMPVSNLLNFPLFPEVDGQLVIYPTAENPLRLPDFLMKRLNENQLNILRERDIEKEKRRYLVYTDYGAVQIQSAEDRELYNLWATWSYDLTMPEVRNRLATFVPAKADENSPKE